jgi:hypothetical protein
MKTISIGRDPSNDIVVNDSFVSRKHAQIILLDNEQIIIKDLGSHNGTFVNGNRITEVNLSGNDIVKCGNQLLDWQQYVFSPTVVTYNYPASQQGNIHTTIIQTPVMADNRNGLGVAGFVLSLVGATLCWIPFFGVSLLILGFTFSLIGFIVGLSKKKSFGLSLAGLIISSAFFIIAIVFITTLSSLGSMKHF